MPNKNDSEIFPPYLFLDSPAYFLIFLLDVRAFLLLKLLRRGDFPLEIKSFNGVVLILSLFD